MTLSALITMLVVQITVTVITAQFLMKVFKKKPSTNHTGDSSTQLPLKQ